MYQTITSFLLVLSLCLVLPVWAQDADTQTAEAEQQETQATDIELPPLVTYIDTPVVEQRQEYTRADIDKMHVQDMPSLFQAAGIQLLSYGPYGLEQKPSIRGFTDETVRVVIDGICVNNAQYGTFDFTTLNVADIERIEIVRGGFTETVAGEGAVGGVIYITTRKKTSGQHIAFDSYVKTYFNADQLLDTASLGAVYSGQLGERTYVTVSAKGTDAQNKYQYRDYRDRVKTREHADVYDGQTNVQLHHVFETGNSWSFSDLTYVGKKNVPGPMYSIPGIQKDVDNNATFNLSLTSLEHLFQFDSGVSWLASKRWYEEGTSTSEHTLNTFSYIGSVESYRFTRIRPVLGLSLDASHLVSTNDDTHTLLSGTVKETTKIFITDIVSLSIPLAVTWSGKNVAFVPKLGIRADYQYVDVLLNGYRMVQFPIMDDLYWKESSGTRGNPDLKPEEGWGAELACNVHDVWLPFSLCVYTNYYKEKIQWQSVGSIWTPVNVASAFYAGVNLSLQKNVCSWLSLRGSAEYLYNRLLDKSNELTYGKRIMYTPDWVASFAAMVHGSLGTVTVESNYMGKRYISNLNASFLKPYMLFNLCAELTKWKYVTPYTRFDNITNVMYESVPEYPMPGRSLTIGARVSL